jgi:hypothetical protein
MSDPISAYRTTCRNADLMLGADPARVRGDATIQLVQQSLDGLRQHRIDAPAARAARAEGHAAMRQLPPDQQARLGPLLEQLDAQIGELEHAGRVHRDHGAPAARPAARTSQPPPSPAMTLSAGLSPDLASLRGSALDGRIQQSLFTDGPQTTRTLRALAALTPNALRDSVRARVGHDAAETVLASITRGAQLQFRARVSERACEGLLRSATRLEAACTGRGLETTLAALHGPERGPLITQLTALGVNADELHGLLARPHDPDARHALRQRVADTLRDGATELRALASRYDASHNMLDDTAAVYGLFAASATQTRAQLGVPADDARSALGSFIAADIAAGRAQQASNDRVALLAGLATSVLFSGLGAPIALEAGVSLARGAMNLGVAHQRANDAEAAMRAGEATHATADAARTHVYVDGAATLAAVAVGAGMSHKLHESLGHAAGLAGGGAEILTHMGVSLAAHPAPGNAH